MARNHYQIASGLTLKPQASAPSDPVYGDIYLDQANGVLWYNGTEWAPLGGGVVVVQANSKFTHIVSQTLTGPNVFSDLNSALADMTDGDSLYIDKGQYTISSSISSSLNNIQIEQHPNAELISDVSGTMLTMSGSNWRWTGGSWKTTRTDSYLLEISGNDNIFDCGYMEINIGSTKAAIKISGDRNYISAKQINTFFGTGASIELTATADDNYTEIGIER